jgi:hypothetical protein
MMTRVFVSATCDLDAQTPNAGSEDGMARTTCDPARPRLATIVARHTNPFGSHKWCGLAPFPIAMAMEAASRVLNAGSFLCTSGCVRGCQETGCNAARGAE